MKLAEQNANALAKGKQHVRATLLHAPCRCVRGLASVLCASFIKIRRQSNIVQHHATILHDVVSKCCIRLANLAGDLHISKKNDGLNKKFSCGKAQY